MRATVVILPVIRIERGEVALDGEWDRTNLIVLAVARFRRWRRFVARREMTSLLAEEATA
jgi:hypothetical protein